MEMDRVREVAKFWPTAGGWEIPASECLCSKKGQRLK